MASKALFYASVAERTAREITARRGNWQNFLDTAARLYKYPFPDQLLIYAQRPDATACAPLETWNESFNRWVRRGSKGIALIDDNGDRPMLRYVFDVSDTEPSQYRSRPVYLWELRQEHREPVLDALGKVYDDVNDTLADSFHNIAKQLAREYYEDNAREIRYRAEDSLLEDFDDFNLGVIFESALANSVAYMLMSRCGFDTSDYFDNEDFRMLSDFNTPDMVYALGTAAGDLSQQVLRDIELIVRKHERQIAAERSVTYERRTDIYPEWGLSATGDQAERAAEGVDGTAGQVREDSQDLPQGTQDDDLQLDAPEREAVPAPSGDAGIGGGEAGAGDERPDLEEQPARQDERPDGLDGGDERLESPSGGDGLERTGLRIEEPETPPEQGGVSYTVESENITDDTPPTFSQVGKSSIEENLSTSSITLGEVDSILRDGGNDKNSALRIAAYFSKNLPTEDNESFLRSEYLSGRWGHSERAGGKGYQFGNDLVSVWFDENGMAFGRGKSAIAATDKTHITWEQAALRVRELYDAGMFVTHDTLDEALYNESLERADDIVEVYQNISRGLSDIRFDLRKAMDKEQQEATKDDWKHRRYLIRGLSALNENVYTLLEDDTDLPPDEVMRLYNEAFDVSEEIPQEWGFGNGHPDSVAQVAELLRDKGELSEYSLILTRLREDIAAFADEPDAPIRFYRNPHRLLNNLELMGLPAHGFPVAEYTPMSYMRFITDDEVEKFLIGSDMGEGKLRMLSHFLHDHTPKENQDFVKSQYGHGGGSWGDGGWTESNPSKGITFKRNGCNDVTLNWNQATKKIGDLIHSGRYASNTDLSRIFNYERLVLARNINNFFYNMAEEYERPFDRDIELNYPKEDEWAAVNGLLDDSDRIAALLGQMQYIYANTPEDDRYYDTRKLGYERLSAFQDGTYTLFPGLENLPDPSAPATSIGQMRIPAPEIVETSGRSAQISLFDLGGEPLLPSVEEQQASIEQRLDETTEAAAAPALEEITQDEIDLLLLTVSGEDKMRIAVQFADSPRSREAVQLVREIYGSIADTLPRPDGLAGYIGIVGENTGVVVAKGLAFGTPNRPETVTENLSWAAVHKRIAELAEDSRFGEIAEPYDLFEQIRDELSERGYVVSGEMIEDGIGDYYHSHNEMGDYREIADFIESGYLVEDDLLTNTGETPTQGDSIEDSSEQGSDAIPVSASVTNLEQSSEATLEQQADTPTEHIPDFETLSQTIYERIMQDSVFTDALDAAQSRGSLRTPINTALDNIIAEHEQNDRAIYDAYLTDDDLTDRLFEIVYRQSWESKQAQQTLQPETVVNAEPEFVGAASEDEPATDVPSDESRTEDTQNDNDLAEEALLEPERLPIRFTTDGLRIVPPPVFFVDWDSAQYDFDLRLYDDRDVIGFNKDGVEYRVGRSGSISYVTTTTGITPWGSVLGHDSIPNYVGQMIASYSEGNLSDEQVRSEYLQVFEVFKAFRAADLSKTNGDFIDVLCNGLFAENTGGVLEMLENNYRNDEIIARLSESVNVTDTMTLESGETADYFAGRYGLQIDIHDKFNTKLSFNWSEIAQTLRALEAQWIAERDSLETEPESIYGTFEEITDPETIAQAEELFGGAEPETVMDINNTSRLNYDLFSLVFPEIFDGSYRSMSYKDEQGGKTLSISHDTTVAGDIQLEIARYNPDGSLSCVPMAVFTADFDNRMLNLIRYRDSETGDDVGIFNLPSPNDAQRLATLSETITDLISDIRDQDYELTSADVFHDAQLEPIPAEPKPNIMDFLKGQADREADAHFQVQRGMSAPVDGAESPEPRFVVAPVTRVEQIWSNPRIVDLIGRNQQSTFFGIKDTQENRYLKTEDGAYVEYKTEEEAQAHADRLNREAEAGLYPQAQVIPAGTNFRITNDQLGEGGAKTKFRYNIDAIATLRKIEGEERTATAEEQQTLSRYVGWGGLPQAFDRDNELWAKEYAELSALLEPAEYESARASTLNAHYTSPVVIKAIYETVERLGFKSGNILEPACGIGNFLGLLPDGMAKSKLYGVELDSVTARIAKQLYPQADIRESGYEKTDMPDAFFDLAIGNVPFGSYGVVDKRYDKHSFLIHDYFFAKTLDQVRPGGIIAFITSKGTLDKQNSEVRKYIAQRAELLGAVRLPNNAFLKNAGTEVTSDIIFLQKRDRPIDIQPDWIHLGFSEDGVPMNRYFADNPEMLLGTMSFDDRMYGDRQDTTCNPVEGADLGEQLKTALSYISGQYTVDELDDLDGVDDHAIPADPNIKNFSYADVDGIVYFRENSLMYPVELPATTLERIKGMIALRDCVHELIALQLDEHGEDEIRAKQAQLNTLYDDFSGKFGLINSTANQRAFNADSAYYLLCSLEILDEDSNLERKADMFTKRTIKQRAVIEHVDTASEALAVSIGEKACADMDYMTQLTGKDEAALFEELSGVIFKDFSGFPDGRYVYRTADEFLSGNVREKLHRYRQGLTYTNESHPNYDTVCENIAALEKAVPKDLDASEISVRLGSTWIEPEYVQQFMYELLKVNYRMQSVYAVNYHQFTGEWQVTGKGRAAYNDVLANVTYGTSRMNAYQIIDDTLNLRDVRVYDTKRDIDGKEKRVLNKKETTLAQQKQELVKQAFKDWIWQDPMRRQNLVQTYNERFNSVRPREYDGSHVTFSGISPEITLRPHQLNAIAHILYGGNTLLAHEVGAGKTFEMVGAAMEAKRLGLCHKSLFAVPNHLTEQWAGEFLRLYPSANILVATKKDFEMRNRKKFCAKIATGDYDAVIIGHTQLEKIPMSRERQERLLYEQIWEIEDGIRELKESRGERFSIKQLEKTKKSLMVRLQKLLEAKTKDDVVTFEQLGVDRLFIDEAHGFKNLFLYTKMRNVAGLSTSEAQKSSDLFMKCRYMDELTNNRGVIFATGTPISNSMTEMYTMQRYLQYDSLSAKGLSHFDSWASIFGETQTSIELAPEGTGYRARTRFAKFHNLPELMCMFKEVADIQTADMLNLPVPDAIYENIIVEPSELQQEMVQELSERAARVHAQLVDARVDNMLKITTDGRKIGLDQRLINPLLPDHEGSKVNACTENVFRIWDETQEDRLTQLVFCDFSTPNKDGRFNIYDDIKAKLLERGIPEDEIAFIHDADTETRKKELFAKVRQGKVRVLFGSTFKMGSGTNVQDRLIAIHDADCPWRPADLEQRAGRIVRQGNKNAEVMIFRYATSGTFDSYLWQTVESKQKFIAQIMTSKSPMRSCEDVDETALSYAEIKALCAGNPLIAEKMNLDVEVTKLRMLKSEHQSQHFRLEDDLLKRYPEQITAVRERIEGIQKDMALYAAENDKLNVEQPSIGGAVTVTAKFAGMTINDVAYAEKEPAAKALLEACKGVTDKKDFAIGSYMGFDMSLRFDSFNKAFTLLLRGSMTYQTELGTDAFGNITRINNCLADLPKKLSGAKSQLESLYQQQESAKAELEKPFALAGELAEKEARLALLNADLNIDGDGGFELMNDTDERDDIDIDPDDEIEEEYDPMAVSAKSARPSLLEGIRSYSADRQPPVHGRKTGNLEI